MSNTVAISSNSQFLPIHIPNCVAYWPFNEEEANSVAYDVVGGYNLSPINNPQSYTGRRPNSRCRQLFAVGNYSAANFTRSPTGSTRPVVAQGQSFTFSFWMYLQPTLNNQGSNSTAFLINFGNTVDSNGQIRLGAGNPVGGWGTVNSRLYHTDSTFTTVWIGNNNNPTNLLSLIPANQWTNIVWLYDSSLHQVRVYLNGTLINTVSATVGKTSSGIAAGLNLLTMYVPGLVQDFALFDRALTQSEITLLNSTNSPVDGSVFETNISNPTDINNCCLWLDASDNNTVLTNISGIPVSNNQTIGYWQDKSGSNRHALQTTINNQPTYRMNILNGKNAIYCSGNHFLSLTAFNITPLTWFLVTRHDGSVPSAAARTPLSLQSPSGGNYITTQMIHSGNNARIGIAYNVARNYFSHLTIDPRGNPYILSGSCSNTGQGLSGNANGIILPSDTAVQDVDGNRSQIGARYRASTYDSFFNGDICELICYDTVLSNQQISQIEKYLSDKWGIGIQKPISGHPEVQDWIDRVYFNGGSVSQETVNSVTDFCYQIDNAGLRSKFLRLNLFCGNNIQACATPVYLGPSAKQRFGFISDLLTYWGSNLPFINEDYNERGTTGGLKGRYTTAGNFDNGPGLRTGLTTGQVENFLSWNKIFQRNVGTSRYYDGLHMSVFCRQLAQQSSSYSMMGAYGGVFGEGRHGASILFSTDNGLITLGPFTAQSTTYYNRINKGLYLHNTFVTDTISSSPQYYSEMNLYAGKNKYITSLLTTGPFALSTADLGIFSENRQGISTAVSAQGLFRCTQRLQSYSIGTTLNETEVSLYYNIINNFQNKLDRGLPTTTVNTNTYGPELVSNSLLTTRGDNQFFTIFRDATTNTSLTDIANLVANQQYVVTWAVLNRRGSISATMRIAGGTIVTGSNNINLAPGLYSTVITPTVTGSLSIAGDNTGVDFDLDYISVRAINTVTKTTTIDSSLNFVTNIDARRWLESVYANGGSVSISTATAVQNFCNSIDSANLRSLFIRLNLFCGDNLEACLVPLYRGPNLNTLYGNTIDQNFFDEFTSSDYVETGVNGGLQGDGWSKGLLTGVTSKDIPTHFHLSTYVSVPNTTISLGYDISAINSDGNNDRIALTNVLYGATPGYVFASYQLINSPYTSTSTTAGFYIGSCLTNTSKLYRNGTSVSSTTNTGSNRILTNYPLMIFGGSQSATNTMRNFSPARLNAYSCGLSMTDQQASDFHNIMQTFQTALNRNI